MIISSVGAIGPKVTRPTDTECNRSGETRKNRAQQHTFVLGPISDILIIAVSILTRDIDIENLSVCPSVCYVPVPRENCLTYRHSFFTIR